MTYTQKHASVLFDRIAPRYDLLNRILSAGTDVYWRRVLVRSCAGLPSARVLDLATGTGDVVRALRGIRPASIVGADPSRAMLVRARNKCGEDGEEFVQAVAERLPFRSSSFDLVTIAFGVRNFADRPAGLREVRRVLRAGGMLRVLEFSVPANSLIRALYMPYFRRVLPRVGGILSGDPAAYQYLTDSVTGFPDPSGFVQELRESGFRNVESNPMTGGVVSLTRAVAA